jgi:hypothetical protein
MNLLSRIQRIFAASRGFRFRCSMVKRPNTAALQDVAEIAALRLALAFWSPCAAGPLSISKASCARRSKCNVER